MNTLQEWRGFYASLGFASIPLRPREKRPLRRGWLEPRDEHWIGAPADANVGILTGAPSGGLVVLDFDTRDGPETVLGMTPDQLAVLTIVVETSRGWHVYALEPGRASSTPREGLDVRGEGGMVVAPPSVHPSGHVYRFVGHARAVVPLAALPLDAAAASAPDAPSLPDVEQWIGLQAPKLREAWRRLREPPSMSFDASRADFAVARCLWEGGYSVNEVAGILLSLPGSRARQRGREYAIQTATRALGARPNRMPSGRG